MDLQKWPCGEVFWRNSQKNDAIDTSKKVLTKFLVICEEIKIYETGRPQAQKGISFMSRNMQ